MLLVVYFLFLTSVVTEGHQTVCLDLGNATRTFVRLRERRRFLPPERQSSQMQQPAGRVQLRGHQRAFGYLPVMELEERVAKRGGSIRALAAGREQHVAPPQPLAAQPDPR